MGNWLLILSLLYQLEKSVKNILWNLNNIEIKRTLIFEIYFKENTTLSLLRYRKKRLIKNY